MRLNPIVICRTPVTIVDNKAKTSAPVSNIANIAIANGSPMAKVLIVCVAVMVLFVLNFQKKMKLLIKFFYLIRLFLLFLFVSLNSQSSFLEISYFQYWLFHDLHDQTANPIVFKFSYLVNHIVCF